MGSLNLRAYAFKINKTKAVLAGCASIPPKMKRRNGRTDRQTSLTEVLLRPPETKLKSKQKQTKVPPKVLLFLDVHIVDAIHADVATEAISSYVEALPTSQMRDGEVDGTHLVVAKTPEFRQM